MGIIIRIGFLRSEVFEQPLNESSKSSVLSTEKMEGS
jgi:hypothetical protein